MPDSVEVEAAVFDREQAAAYLRIGPRSLDRAVAARDIDVVRIGRSVRFTQRACDDYLARHTERADANKPRGRK